jgi:Fe-S-cluster containining protein
VADRATGRPARGAGGDGGELQVSWYDGGVRFACQRCGNCCTGVGSVVRLTRREIEALARSRGLTPGKFVEDHTRERLGMRVLLDTEGGACEWLDRAEDGTTSCRVQDAKPDQCRSYPFWPRKLATREAWEREGEGCRGIGQGELIPREEVDRLLGREQLDAQLDTLYAELDAELAEIDALCRASGDCCDFPAAGHRLYTSRLEADRFVRGVDLTGWDPQSGLCPAWKDRRCTAREHRPTGCRVYYCDADKEELLQQVMERYLTQLKWLHERHELPWDYRDWIDHLACIQAERAAR